MESRSNKRYLLFMALLAALSLVAAACGGGNGGDTAQQDEGEIQEGGQVLFGAEQEPAELNCNTVTGNLAWCVYTVESTTLVGAYEVQPDFTFQPEALAEEATVEEGPPFKVTYTLKEEAQWSDGTPLSADDMIFTWKTYTDPKNKPASRTGYEDITDAEKVDEKTVTFTFKKPFAGYKDIFDPIYPAHALEGENWNKVWNDEIVNPKTGEPIASGPFIFDEWKKGSQITVVRNDNWWGEEGPHLDRIVFRFVTDTSTEIQALKGQEVDMIYPQPQLQLTELDNVPGVVNDLDAGPVWQHLDFQLNNDLLKQDFVRQAMGHAINREAIVERLVQQIQPDAEVLQNVIFVTNDERYEPHWDQWNFDPDQAQQILEDNGCQQGGDGIYECDGEKLSFGYVSTAGNELRELQFEIIQEQLRQVGIEVTNEFDEADIVFGKVLSAENWDTFQFAWVGSPDPTPSNPIFVCDGPQNFNNYCNEEVTRLMEQAATEIDPARQAELYNQADALMAEDIPMLPLWQMPQPFYYYDKVHGIDNNATNEGPTWNSEQWWVEGGGSQ